MRAEDVAASVLDVAFAEDAPQAFNIVNPQRPPWVKIMSSIRDAVLEQKSGSLTSDHLTMVSFVDWVVRLEKRAASATPEDLVNIVSVPIRILPSFLMVRLCSCANTDHVCFSVSLRSNYSNFSERWRGMRSRPRSRRNRMGHSKP